MINNVDKLNLKISKMSNLVDSVVVKAVEKNTKIIQAEAKLLCPVDKGELRNSIHTTIKKEDDCIKGITYTNKSYAAYVEFGTGPKGAAEHTGTSPNVNISYSDKGWVYPTDEGFIYTEGQPAKPYMYPALKNNEKEVAKNIKNDIKKSLEELKE